jgi:hypothetical protein
MGPVTITTGLILGNFNYAVRSRIDKNRRADPICTPFDSIPLDQ